MFSYKTAQAVIPALMISMLTVPLQAQGLSTLHEGTPIRMKINRTVSSASAQEGEKVDFETLDDVKSGDSIVIPKGSMAIGTVTEAAAKRSMGKGGKLTMNIDYVRLANGDKIVLRGVQGLKGGGHTGAMTAGIVATAIVFWPAAPLFLFMHGKDISVPEGHEITVYTNTEYTPMPIVQSASTSKAQERQPNTNPPLHDVDIFKLKKAGLSDELILAKIKSSRGMYEIGTDDLLRLKAAGLSDEVISAMMAAISR